MKMSNKKPVLTKKDLRKTAYRWIPMSVACFNYESQMAGGIVYAFAPALRKIYEKDEEFGEAIENHFKFFNTNPWIANIILGAALAMEDTQGIEGKEAIQDFKTSMMGPMAGVGDTIIWVLLPTIMGSISAYMSLEGNPLGMIAWLLIYIACFILRTRLVEFGYNQGLKIITQFGRQLSIFTEAASALGLMVVGALIPSVINVTVPYVYKAGEVSMEIQPLLDQVLPSLIPVILTFICYKLLGTKKMNMTRVIILLIIFSMIAAATGILA